MTILVVEDLDVQIETAKKELADLGFKIAIARTLVDAMRLMKSLGIALKGIITDLHFPESDEPIRIERTSDKPNGLAIVAKAVVNNIPVAVCSDVDHHFCSYAKNVIDVLADHRNYTHGNIPFVMDRKDWKKAGEELKKLIEKQN
jgi:CheY-like chemotaxis protein